MCYAAGLIRTGVHELRQHASRYLAPVEAGEAIEVTARGRPVALFSPPNPAQTARERLVATGKLRPASAPFELPSPAAIARGNQTTAEVLEGLREERLP